MDQKDDFQSLLNQEENLNQSEDFSSLIGGQIKTIYQDKVEVQKKAMDKDLAKIRQQNATRKPEDVTDTASSGFVKMLDPNEILDYKKPGIQPYVMKKLRNGEYIEADYIDLHGKTIEQAYEHVMKFLDFAKRHEFRTVLIIHGKGNRSNPRALMKSHVAHWLKQIPDVLAFHSAPEWKGGSGAVYVLLKKGDKQSIINREFFQKR